MLHVCVGDFKQALANRLQASPCDVIVLVLCVCSQEQLACAVTLVTGQTAGIERLLCARQGVIELRARQQPAQTVLIVPGDPRGNDQYGERHERNQSAPGFAFGGAPRRRRRNPIRPHHIVVARIDDFIEAPQVRLGAIACRGTY